MQEYVESSLFLAAKAGDIGAFELLIEPYHKKIYSLALKVSGNRNDASDLAQRVFVKAYKAIRGINTEKQLPVLIYKSAADICLKMNGSKRLSSKINRTAMKNVVE